MVRERRYISEAELMELHSFCQMLPGPSSTQMITGMGYKLGGPSLALLSLLIWILPATIIMTLVVVVWHYFDKRSINLGILHFIQPMAVGFIAAAAIRLFQMLERNFISVGLYLLGAIAATLFKSPWVFPVLLVFGAWLSQKLNQNKFPVHKPQIRPKWWLIVLFFGVLLISALVGNISGSKPVLLFENSYQYGSIVFGGGNVLIPMMYKQYVTFKGYLDANDFILGVGFLQSIPGPVFSISTFVNGMAMQEYGLSGQILGCILGTIGIFLPGTLLSFFFFPIWEDIKRMPLVRKAIDGIKAVSAGLVLAAACLLFQEVPYEPLNWLVMLITMATVLFTRVPPPVIVFFTVIAGILIPA